VALLYRAFSSAHLAFRTHILNSYVDTYSHFPSQTFSNQEHI